ncbi:MAG: outer membrane beta-barrel family protein, partial [Agriterribacter sp.]
REKSGRHQDRFASVSDCNDKQSVSMQSFFSKTRFHQLFQSDEWYYNTVSSPGKATSLKQRVFDMTGITFNYSFKPDTSGSILKIVADYLQTDRSETNEFAKLNIDPAKQRFWRNDAPTSTTIYTIQSDFSKRLKRQTLFQSGLKYASLVRDNELTTEDLLVTGWTLNEGQSNHFMYTENILMVYTSLEHAVKRTTIKAGLRAEKTFSSGNETVSATTFSRKYAGLFPSLSLMQLLNAESGTSITAAYSRRLTRPALNELNPARLEFSNYTALTGNPNLLPQYSHHFSLSWQFFKHHNAEVYFVRTNQFIALSANAGANNSIDYLFENTGSTAEYGVTYSSTIQPFAIWSITNNAAVYHSTYRFNGEPYRQTSFYAQTLHTVAVPNLAEFDFIADYRSPYIYTNLYTYGNFSMDIGITKKLLKSKARMRVSFTDILNTSREKEWTDENENSISFYRKRPTRTVRLSFTYQFSSGKKMQPKSIEQGGTDEKRRIGN